MISIFENIKQITPPIDFTEINHLLLSDLVYNVLDDKQNVPVILSIIKEHLKLNVKYKILPPRKGDPDCLVADISFAKNMLNYQPKYDIMRILETAYEWEKNRD